MSALLEIWHTIQGILTHADWITLAIIAVIAIAAGCYHSLALCADGTLAAWGDVILVRRILGITVAVFQTILHTLA